MMSASSKRLKYLAASQNRKMAYSETDRAYIGLEDIESWTGRLMSTERAEPEGTVSLYEAGDVLFGKLRPYLAKVHLAEEAGSCSTESLVLRPQRSLHPAYLKYVLLDPKRIDEINASTFGAQMPRASWAFIGNYKLFVPDLATQKAIAAFLDRETARIDKLIAKKERLAALVDEKRSALITAAVTGQIHLEAKHSRTPKGGGEGERLRFIASLNPSKTEAGDLASYGNVTFAPMDALADGLGGLDTNLERSADELADGSYSYFAEGDLLLAKVTPCFENGKKALVTGLPKRIGFATSEVHVIRPNLGKIDPNYLLYLLSSETFRAAGMSSMTGAGGLRRISDNAIKDFKLPITNLSNQKSIAAYLNCETEKLDILKTKTLESIFCLREYRAALITAAVTGQIDIRENLPAAISTSDRDRFRLSVTAEIIHRLPANPKRARVKVHKITYLAETHLGINGLRGNFLREAAGPLDRALIEETERSLEVAGYYRANQTDGTGTAVTYTPLAKAGQHKVELATLLGSKAEALRSLIAMLADLDRHATEAITTLYAVWNDALIDGETPDDATIINGVLHEWHPEKGEKFTAVDLATWLAWMRRHQLIPRGEGPRTTPTMTPRLL